MKFLYIGSFGSEDFTLTFAMAKGTEEAGHDVEIALQGDALVFFNETVTASVQACGTAEPEGIARLHSHERDPSVWVRTLLPCPWGRGRVGPFLVQGRVLNTNSLGRKSSSS